MRIHDRNHFYRYFCADGAAAVLEHCSVRLSSPKRFNDPFDVQLYQRPPFTADEMRITFAKLFAEDVKAGRVPEHLAERMPREYAERAIKNLQGKHTDEELIEMIGGDPKEFERHYESRIQKTYETLQEHMRDQFVYCLTEDKANLLMWSHYADHHRGAVIRFACENKESIFQAAEKVRYLVNPPTLGTKEEWPLLGGKSTINVPRSYKEMVLTKGIDWAYEKEWRIAVPLKEFEGRPYCDLRISRSEISEVILGCNISPENRDRISQIARQNYPGIRILQAQKSKRHFAVEFSEVP